MKLICETLDKPLEYLVENTDKGKRYYIEGIYMQAEKPNRNRRIYERTILENAVGRYISEQVKNNRAVGELDHPEGPTINLDKVSHRITNLEWNGNDVIGKALVLDTPSGKIVQGLLEGGVQLGVSSRGMGSLSEAQNGMSKVGSDFILAAVDVVQDPSAHNAFVNGIMEGVDWRINNGKFIAEKVTEAVEETGLKSFSDKERLLAFNKFLSDRFLDELGN